jgi:hypothetical protein
MREIVALETEIMDALPRADAAAAMFDASAPIHATIASAQFILCNCWRGPGERLERLREIARLLRSFNEAMA